MTNRSLTKLYRQFRPHRKMLEETYSIVSIVNFTILALPTFCPLYLNPVTHMYYDNKYHVRREFSHTVNIFHCDAPWEWESLSS